jgi:hypothetical protein
MKDENNLAAVWIRFQNLPKGSDEYDELFWVLRGGGSICRQLTETGVTTSPTLAGRGSLSAYACESVAGGGVAKDDRRVLREVNCQLQR